MLHIAPVKAFLNGLTMPKFGVLRVFWLFSAILVALPSFALDLTVWRFSKDHPGLILPVREGETPSGAAHRFEQSFRNNAKLMELTKRSKFPELDKSESRFSELSFEDFNHRALIIANMPQDLIGTNERIRAFSDPFLKEGVNSYIAPLAGDLGLTEAESNLYVELLDNRFMSFVAIGGDDVDRTIFGGVNTHSVNVNSVRDQFEAKLIARKILTIKAKLIGRKDRLLGICRGAQIIAMITGLSVGEDIKLEIDNAIPHGRGTGEGASDNGHNNEQSHIIRVSKTSHSLLYRLLDGLEEFIGNSYHHQYIKHVLKTKMGITWERSGVSPEDGITEALEFEDSVILLQFHPEYQAIRSHGVMQEHGLRIMKGLAHFLSPQLNRCEAILR